MAAPAVVLGAEPVMAAPARGSLTVGYYETGVMGQLPLLVAQVAGYFEDAGFDDVTLVEVDTVLRDVLNGDLDFGVMPSKRAFKQWLDDPAAPAVAGFKNYAGRKGAYGGDLLLAQPGLVEHEPSTVTSFLSAYIRALQDLADPEAAAAVLDLLEGSAISVPDDVAGKWDEQVAAFAPFDGGFGSYDDTAGYGELLDYLTDTRREQRALPEFLAEHTLNISQAGLGLGANPGAGMVGPPAVSDIRVGLPLSTAAAGPIAVAQDAGYFEAAGFDSVEIIDVEAPLLGLLNGELDFAIVDMVDAADGASQGLPVPAIAGHRNYSEDGAYGGDMLLTTADLLDDDTTAAAFLIAYLQALADLREDAASESYAPFDGGFGDPTSDGGTGELAAYLTQVLDAAPELDEVLDTEVLRFAQAWWGLPANPTDTTLPVTSGTTTDEEAE